MRSFRDQEDSVMFKGVVSQCYEEEVRDVLISSWGLPASCKVIQAGFPWSTRRVADAREVLLTNDESPHDSWTYLRTEKPRFHEG